ncbi:MAG: NAD(P)-dependent oxidoreductase [Chloroflexi bacterium]|nr:NAD(P)-dependent oxidoreductase [Chloroflexota bacterium]
MTEKIGFIGLGRMGLPMAYNLLRAGHDITVHNRSQEKVRQIADAGATAATSTLEVMASCDIVLACLPDVATCEAVLLGDDGALPNARPGQIIVDHSTVGASTSKACAAAAEQRGAMFLDAPISGGTERATDGTLTIMVGGPAEAYKSAQPLFDVIGAVVRHVGPTGSGTAAKLVNQLLVGVHMVAAAEAMLLGAKSGADPALVFELVNSGWGQSFLLGRNAPAMLDRDFDGVRTQLRVFLKDLGLIQEMARDLGTPIAAGDLAYKLLAEAVDQGLGDLDSAAIVLPMEEQAQFQIKRMDA